MQKISRNAILIICAIVVVTIALSLAVCGQCQAPALVKSTQNTTSSSPDTDSMRSPFPAPGDVTTQPNEIRTAPAIQPNPQATQTPQAIQPTPLATQTPKPFFRNSKELSWDNGTYAFNNSPWADVPGAEIGVVFSSPSYPARIAGVRIYVGEIGAPATAFNVSIRSLTPEGVPSIKITDEALVLRASMFGGWVNLDLSQHEIIVKGDFCVSMEWLSASGRQNRGMKAQFMGTDGAKPTHTWWKNGSEDSGWHNAGERTEVTGVGNAMVRVRVEY